MGGLGAALGSLVFGALTDRIGRRAVFCITILVFSLMTGVCAITQNLGQLMVARVIVGLGLGGLSPASTVLFAEYLPPAWRGRLMAWFNGWFGMGVFGAYAVGTFIIVPFGWRWGFVAGIVPAALAFLAFRRLPESARYLLSRGRMSEAAATVESVERAVLGRLSEEPVIVDGDNPASLTATSAALPSKRAAFRALVRPGLRGTTLSLVALWTLPALFGVTGFYPLLLTQRTAHGPGPGYGAPVHDLSTGHFRPHPGGLSG